MKNQILWGMTIEERVNYIYELDDDHLNAWKGHYYTLVIRDWNPLDDDHVRVDIEVST